MSYKRKGSDLMNLNLFKELLENKLSVYESFMMKATDYQMGKNKIRPPKKRWNERKIKRSVNAMWITVVENIFEKVKSLDGCPGTNEYTSENIWIEFMEKHEIFDQLEVELMDIEFE
ncbi:MAG TPA: hypothetical protein H9829_03635 [Candidatus Tetragenococcus pullicola]|nr:hypothetical protein [Candidatus Tetragenococcus pullicola]